MPLLASDDVRTNAVTSPKAHVVFRRVLEYVFRVDRELERERRQPDQDSGGD